MVGVPKKEEIVPEDKLKQGRKGHSPIMQ